MSTTIGQVRWFTKGYGFLTVVSDGEWQGREVFVHASGLVGAKTLEKGEYVEFAMTDGDDRGPVAKNVTGVCGGALMATYKLANRGDATSKQHA